MPQDKAKAAIWYQKAVAIWRKDAKQGDAKAQYKLGSMYTRGFGVPKNDSQAVAWYLKAAEQGHAGAQLSLGLMYYEGKGVPKNENQAMKWYLKAAEQGNESAKSFITMIASQSLNKQAIDWTLKAADQGYKLARSTIWGMAAQKFNKQAIDWVHKNAIQGDAEAQFWLGMVYSELWKKYRQSQNAVTAYMWLNIAAANGYDHASGWREGISQDMRMTKAQIEKAQQRSQKCLDSNYKEC